MEYEVRTIAYAESFTSTSEITAYVGVGTGLAYAVFNDGKFLVIHVSSGLPLPHTLHTSDEAKRYLEALVELFKDRWLSDMATFKERYRRHKNFIDNKARQAYEAALSDPEDEFFLYARTEDDVFTESNTDAANVNPSSKENQRIAEELLRDYPEANKVIMTRMDTIGKHHDLRTFLRIGVAMEA